MATQFVEFPESSNVLDYSKVCYEDPVEYRGGEVHGAPYEQPSLIKHLIKQLRPGQDLTRTAIPSSFLDPRSLLERFGDTLMHIDILDDDSITSGNEHDRFMTILKWYLSAWHYKTHGVKKPYNPVIGETYACLCKTKKSETAYISEQTSHHPPISAFYLENQKQGYCVNGYLWTKSQFTGNSVLCGMVGECTIELPRHNEVYITRIPNFAGTGLFFGKLSLQLIDEITLSCEKTGYSATISFHAKPMLGGEFNVVKAVIKKNDEILYHLDGKWDIGYTLIDYKTKEATQFLDIQSLTVLPKLTLKEEYEGPYESRRLWEEVTKIIRGSNNPDWDTVTKKKALLEEDQRKLACHQSGDAFKPWVTKCFDARPSPHYIKIQNAYEFKYKDNKRLLNKDLPQRSFLCLSRNAPDVRATAKPLKELLH